MGRTRHVVVAAGVLGALVAGCGSDAEKSATPVAKKQSAGNTIKIGFITNLAGPYALPEVEVGSKAGEQYVNEELGGINGRKLEVIRCGSDGSPEKSIDCANKLVEQKVAMIQQGVDLGADATLPILAGAKIPMVGHVAFGGPKEQADPNAFFLGAAVPAYGAAALKYYADRGIKNIRFFLTDAPAGRQFSDGVLTPTAKKLGLDYKSVYYKAQSPQWSVLATTALSSKPGATGSPSATDPDCIGFTGALRGGGYTGPILAASCGLAVQKLGKKAAGMELYSDFWSVHDVAGAPPAKQKELATYMAAMKKAGSEKAIPTNAAMSFADTVNISRILGTVDGTVDGPAVSKAMRATKDFDLFMGPKVSCNHKAWPGQSACSSSLLFYKVGTDGKLKAQTKDFVDAGQLLAG